MFVKLKKLRALKISLIYASISFFSISALADNCPDGKHWVSPHSRSGYVRYDGVFVKPANVSGHCRTNPRGYDKWHQALSNEKPKIWGFKSEKAKKWTEEEIERVYDAIATLPPQLIELKNVKIYRMAESVSKENPATSNYNDIVLYDLAFKYKIPIEQILAHELSHVLYNTLTRDQIKEFAHSADWMNIRSTSDIWVVKKEKNFIEEDSRSSLDEDFANHIEHYLFRNEPLKKRAPSAYQWIHKTFGKEFKIQEKK